MSCCIWSDDDDATSGVLLLGGKRTDSPKPSLDDDEDEGLLLDSPNLAAAKLLLRLRPLLLGTVDRRRLGGGVSLNSGCDRRDADRG